MGTGLISLGLGLLYAWAMVLLDWNYVSRRRTRYGWPQSDSAWQIPILLVMTAVLAWAAWRYFTR